VNRPYDFERNNPIHLTRDAKGLNRLRPQSWLRYNDQIVQSRTVELLCPVIGHLQNPVVLSVGVGHGGLFQWLWREPATVRVGIDINHEVMVKALGEYGRAYFQAVEGDALRLPLAERSVDIVVYDFVLHHLVGQAPLQDAIAEGFRVLRPRGYLISREPSSYSPSGCALNLLNHFKLMHKLTGASNQEFALSPPELIKMFERHGSVLLSRGLTYLFAHRMPPPAQDLIGMLQPYLFRGRRGQWLADFLLYVVQKL
jgi:ubiquinone/menaquinone biosynthesis C-methylase UbiE